MQADLLTKDDISLLADLVADEVLKKISAYFEKDSDQIPEMMTGKEIIERHFCGIGGYATLKRRVDEIKTTNPELLDEIVIKREKQHTLYNSQKLKAWYEGQLDKKKEKQKIDPRLMLKGVG